MVRQLQMNSIKNLGLGSRLPGTRPEFLESFRVRAGETQKCLLLQSNPDLHRCSLGVALEQETFLGLSGPRPKRLLVPSLINFRGNPGIRALYQAIGIPNLGW